MSKEIRKKIDDLYLELEDVSITDTFVLNPKVLIVSKKIEALQAECKHEFVNGQCKFCDLEAVNE